VNFDLEGHAVCKTRGSSFSVFEAFSDQNITSLRSIANGPKQIAEDLAQEAHEAARELNKAHEDSYKRVVQVEEEVNRFALLARGRKRAAQQSLQPPMPPCQHQRPQPARAVLHQLSPCSQACRLTCGLT